MRKQATERKCWPWLAMAGILAVVVVVFHLLALRVEEHSSFTNEWLRCRNAIGLAFILVALLLFGISIYSWVFSKTHEDVRFKTVFAKVMHSDWMHFVLFEVLMVVVVIVWGGIWNQVFDVHSFFFKSNRWNDIKSSVFRAPIVEEAKYRLLPFLIAVLPLVKVKSRRWKTILGCFFGLMLFCVQMLFGVAHIDPVSYLMGDTLQPHLLLQGGAGVLFAVTFGVVLFHASRMLQRRLSAPNMFKPILMAFPLAYLASCLVHATSNLSYILFCTF